MKRIYRDELHPEQANKIEELLKNVIKNHDDGKLTGELAALRELNEYIKPLEPKK